ncbi:MBL fold metallo-hydrolase [Lederbergia ruris]|uniref:MBL fold metallo-hydrolase n=1 Tax=Lederbergia ruris TaxID=217495 RepID=UPI0039A2D7D0
MGNSERGVEILEELKETVVPEGILALWFLGQNSVLIKGTENKIVCIDPYLDPAPHRAFAPPFQAELLTNVDYVCISHDHTDHLDPYTVEVLAKVNSQTKFIAPAFCHEQLRECGVKTENLVKADTSQELYFTDIRIKAIPAAHEEFEYYAEMGHRFVGFILDWNGVKVYHAGDTVVYPNLVETLKEETIDLALLPINGRDFFRNQQNIIGNMDVREAAELGVAANVDTIIPLHYDMFPGNSEKPGRIIDYLYEHYPMQKSHVCARFEKFMYVSPHALMKK